MADSQADWLSKLKKFVPGWWFEDDEQGINQTIILAFATVFQAIQQDTDDGVSAKFLTKNTTPMLDFLGSERDKDRLSGEDDADYVARIQRITSETDYADVKAAIDRVLVNGKSVIRDAVVDSPYCNAKTFCDLDYYVSDFKYGQYFLVVLLPQNPSQFSFCDNHYFADWDYAGSSDPSGAVYNKVIAAINSLRAGGLVYRVVVSRHSAIY